MQASRSPELPHTEDLLDWTGRVELARSSGMPASTGWIRRQPEDFRVTEELGFEPSGEGPHTLLRVAKSGATTVDVAKLLARHAGAHPRDAGYCGLKDKHAAAEQWFSVPYAPGVDWQALDAPGVRVVSAHRHRRKLKRGAHAANRFAITVHLDRCEPVDLERRLEHIRGRGVPNYFGEQRFGRRVADDARRLQAGRRLPRFQRSMTLSAIRSALFNRVLDRRVRDGTWDRALPGEYVNLAGTRSGFAADADDPDVPPRVAALDLHPTAPLYGRGDSPATGDARLLEAEVLEPHGRWCELLIRSGLQMERRPTRCVARDLSWRLDELDGTLNVEFSLQRGQFATMVLREIVDYRDVTRHPDGVASGSGEEPSRAVNHQ